MSAVSWPAAQPRAICAAAPARLQRNALLNPVSIPRRAFFARKAPVRRQPIVRAEQKDNDKDSKADKSAEKLVKGLTNLPHCILSR